MIADCSQVAHLEQTGQTRVSTAVLDAVSAVDVLADFALPGDQRDWRVVNDVVMGGVSRSAFEVDGGCGVFAGVVSSARGGGFASVRTQLRSRVSGDTDSIAIRVRGDGKRYQFRVRTSELGDGPTYRHEFDTVVGRWTVVCLPASGFISSFGGRADEVPKLELSDVRQIGFLIADEQLGRFALEIDWIATV